MSSTMKAKFGRVGIAAAVAGAALFGAVAVPSTAFAAEPQAQTAVTIDFGDGSRLANGAAVQIPVTATCTTPPDWTELLTMRVNVRVQQVANESGGLASAMGHVDIPCTGNPETVTASLFAGGLGFVEGVAWGEINAYDYDTGQVEVKKEFQIS